MLLENESYLDFQNKVHNTSLQSLCYLISRGNGYKYNTTATKMGDGTDVAFILNSYLSLFVGR